MSVLSKVSIRVKIVFGCAVMVIMTLIGSILSFVETSSLTSEIARVDRVMRKIDVGRSLRYQSLSMRLSTSVWLNPVSSRAEYTAQYAVMEDLVQSILSNLDWYPKQSQHGKIEIPEELELFTNFKKAFGAQITNAIRLEARAKEVEGNENASALLRDYFTQELNGTVARAAIEETSTAMTKFLSDTGTTTVGVAFGNASTTIKTTLIVAILVLIGGILVSIWLSTSITKAAGNVLHALLANSSTISTSSTMLAAGAKGLAEGASQQAAAVEEISASLEEVSSMIRQNADNATQASKLTAAASEMVDATNKAMQRSLAANEEIAKASNETSKIIKTIDEIAFQTNLLSLNAAVEAARAGEAGAGFAVVADEVRGLSMRSAEASKRTAEMIEQTISKVQEGVGIFNETGKYIDEVVDQTHKIRQLIDEVAAASGEQAKGVEQINKGVSEMEKVIQRNAANSEESAASTMELRIQMDDMDSNMQTFEAFIYGAGHVLHGPGGQKTASGEGAPPPASPLKRPPSTGQAAAAPLKRPAASGQAPAAPLKRPASAGQAPAAPLKKPAANPPELRTRDMLKEEHKAEHHIKATPQYTAKAGIKPEKVIPLDDDDMKDF